MLGTDVGSILVEGEALGMMLGMLDGEEDGAQYPSIVASVSLQTVVR